MNQEQPKQYSNEEIKKMEEMRKRVSGLGKEDMDDENSVYDLAKAEDKYREEWKEDALSPEKTDKYADKYTTQELEKIETKRKSMIDQLTGLGNRRALETKAEEELIGESKLPIEKEKRKLKFEEKRRPIHSLIILDLDHFKKINDTYGHAAGDMVLREVAKAIKNSIRNKRSAYRYGGEEFAIFLSETNSEDAEKVAERIRKSVEDLEVEVDNKTKIKITASFGISDTTQIVDGMLSDKLLKEMIDNSDAALYQSKNSGRNKVSKFISRLKEEKSS